MADFYVFYISNFAICVFSKAVSMFEDDEWFNAVERPRDREDLFHSCLDELLENVSFFE